MPSRPRSAREVLAWSLPCAPTLLDPENCWLNLLQRRHSAVNHRFRMPDHQIAAGAQMRTESVDDLALGLLVEIDQNVAAEDDVDIPVYGIARIHQVHPHEMRQAPQFRHHP